MSTLVLIRIISMLGKCSRMLNRNKKNCEAPGPGSGPCLVLTWSQHGPTTAWFHSWLKLGQE